MDVQNYTSNEISLYTQSAFSDIILSNVGEYVGAGSLINYPFLITSSLPNISPHPVDPIHEICNKIESLSNAISSTDDEELGGSISSEESIEIEIISPEEEVRTLVDKISMLNKQACNGLTEERSVSQMMIYPRANTPQPGGENLLPTIIISDSSTLKPLSRCPSYVSVKSFKNDNDKFTPQVLAESSPNISLDISEIKSETTLNMSLDTSSCIPGCDNDTILVADSEPPQSSSHSKSNESLHENNAGGNSNYGKQMLQTAALSRSMLSLQVLECGQTSKNASQNKNISQFSNLYKRNHVKQVLQTASISRSRLNANQNKNISQFSNISKSSVSLHLTDHLKNNSLCISKPILYTSNLSYSNISINLAGKDSTKNRYLDENENSIKVEHSVSNEKLLPKMSDIDNKSVFSKKFLKSLLPTDCFCLDLTIFDGPNKSSSSVSINYFPVQNHSTKHCGSKVCQSVEIPSSSDRSSSQIYLEQYGYPEESIFDGLKCSIM